MSSWRPSEEHERFHIDSGPRINALQVVSEALDIQQQDEDDCHDVESVSTAAASSPPAPAMTTTPFLSASTASTGTKTIVASDSDVSNGFVKSGRSLPYVFEASESGVRKRSSKILPVCAVCGKRFVCVTTMKRHLVTHTGEKPFSCKVCGKQYTQKGNLRVHERTHRNDRPFECNICHQKFYRKEPMQKHQWRQHGIVHFKSRPPNAVTEQDTQPMTAPTPTPTAVAAPPPPPATRPTISFEPPKPLIPLRPAKPSSYTALVDSLRASSREASPYRSDSLQHANNSPPAAHQTQIDVPKFTEASSSSQPPAAAVAPPPEALASSSRLEFKHAKSNESSLRSSTPPSPTPTAASESFSYSSILNEAPNTHLLLVPNEVQQPEPQPQPQQQHSEQPIKLKMKMAYQREQHQNEVQNLDNDLHDMKIVASEMVECQCKTCGNTFSVMDPYNFRCNNCNVKYTSLPTHLIADPLQCIGCCAVFPHKPALKAHQTVLDKERPFRCCKCGYGFRQKAHLQKHQWRIHRRKLEPDPNMKEAEAFFEVIRGHEAVPPQPAPVATITMQDIINKSVEKSIGAEPRNLMKTSSKYYSEVLGLEYEPKSSSEDDDSRDQPLDLSPAKKPTSELSRENNPLLNQPPSLPPVSNNSVMDYPVWKRQKLATSSGSSHTTLPPISGLQKPMSLVVTKNYKHSSWIPNEIHNPAADPTTSVSTKNSENNNFVRSQLELIKSSNVRTV